MRTQCETCKGLGEEIYYANNPFKNISYEKRRCCNSCNGNGWIEKSRPFCEPQIHSSSNYIVNSNELNSGWILQVSWNINGITQSDVDKIDHIKKCTELMNSYTDLWDE